MNPNRTIAITESERPIAAALTAAFSAEGNTVVNIPSDVNAVTFAQQYPAIDVLLQIADALPVGPTLEQPEVTANSMMCRALIRSFQLMQAVGGKMVARRQGCILTVGGLAGSKGWPGWAQASALQGALLGLTRSLAVEWAPQNVRVLYLACGAAEGEPAVLNGKGPTLEELTARTPLGHVAKAEEIAQVALYLASSDAGSITGTEIRADGGWSSWGLLK